MVFEGYLIPLIIAATFPIGAFIYTKTKEELDLVISKLHLERLKLSSYTIPFIIGWITAYFHMPEAYVVAIALGLLAGSFLIRKKAIWKHSFLQSTTFISAFLLMSWLMI